MALAALLLLAWTLPGCKEGLRAPGGAPPEPWCRSFRASQVAGGAPLMTVYGQPLKAGDPDVLYDEEAGKFKMWYTIYRRGVLGIAYAESADGLVWDNEIPGTLPHVLQPTPGSWDRDGLETVSVLKLGGRYRMWYYGRPCDRPADEKGRVRCIGMATSDDGIRWTKHPAPVLRPTQAWERPYLRWYVEDGARIQAWDGGVEEPAVIWDAASGLFRMWYAGFTLREVTLVEGGRPIRKRTRLYQIGHATSPDGARWTKHPDNPVFRPLLGQHDSGWESPVTVSHTHVMADPAHGYHLFYFSGYSLGHAYSPDGIRWERDANNPMVRYRPDTGLGAMMYQGPSAVLRGDAVWLYYAQSPPGARDWRDATRLGREVGLAVLSCAD